MEGVDFGWMRGSFMDRYLTGATLWPDGWTKLRVDFVPRLPETAERHLDDVSPSGV